MIDLTLNEEAAKTPELPEHIRELAEQTGADIDVLENRWAKVALIAMHRPDLANSWAAFLGDLPDNARHQWHTLDLAMMAAAVREWHRGRGVSKGTGFGLPSKWSTDFDFSHEELVGLLRKVHSTETEHGTSPLQHLIAWAWDAQHIIQKLRDKLAGKERQPRPPI